MSNSQNPKICGEKIQFEIVCEFILSLGYDGQKIIKGFGKKYSANYITFCKEKSSIELPRMDFEYGELQELFEKYGLSMEDFKEFVEDFKRRNHDFEKLIDQSVRPNFEDIKRIAKDWEEYKNTEH